MSPGWRSIERVEMTATGPVVDAGVVAGAFGLDPREVLGLMRDKRITSRCERGVDDDAGRWRLTFWHADRALRLTVDDTGAILSRARFPAPRPQKAR